MSRTDKDLPYWYAERYRPQHRCKTFNGSFLHTKPCDLPDFDFAKVREAGNSRAVTLCFWEPIHERDWWQPSPPKRYLDLHWNNPQRRMVRDKGRQAIHDYRANGDTDIDVVNVQHRHGASWYWW